jgi:anti-sigma regulatory factor (Ser/Thr protein kinase)
MERAPGPRDADGIRLPAEPASAAIARDFVRQQLRGTSHQDLEDAAILCVTELVANVARHTDCATCVVKVLDEPDDVLIEVIDEAPEAPIVRNTPPMADHGRGLQIVDALAGEWGIKDLRPAGKAVWLRLVDC